MNLRQIRTRTQQKKDYVNEEELEEILGNALGKRSKRRKIDEIQEVFIHSKAEKENANQKKLSKDTKSQSSKVVNMTTERQTRYKKLTIPKGNFLDADVELDK